MAKKKDSSRTADRTADRSGREPRASGAGGASSAVWRLEALGIVLVLGAIGCLVALFSFRPSDTRGAESLVGPVGRAFAEYALGGVGVVGYLLLTGFGAAAGLVLVVRMRWPRLGAVFAAVGVILALSVLAHLAMGTTPLLGSPAGGLMGGVIAELARRSIGSAGAALAAMAVGLVSALSLLEISLGTVLTQTAGLFSAGVLALRGSIETWLEARAHGRAKESELLDAHRDRLARVELTRAEREEKLRRGLEEKKRAAILKAEAKAEQKVLARRAAEEARKKLEAEEAALAELSSGAVSSPPVSSPPVGSGPPAAAVGSAEPSPVVPVPVVAAPIVPAAVPVVAAPVVAAAPAAVAALSPVLAAPAPVPVEAAAEAQSAAIVEPARGVLPFELPSELDEDEDDAPIDPQGLLGPAIIPHRREAPTEAMLEASVPGHQLALLPPPTRTRQRRTYELPPLRLLDYKAPPPIEIDREDLRTKATRLEEKLRTYNVDGRVTAIRPGPVVTTYEYLPAPGVKVSKIASLSDDIAMAMTARSVRIIAPIPGKGVVGIELPNDHRESVFLKELIAHDRFHKSKSLLTLALGKDTEGEVQTRDLQKMPHILVAGTTGSGKSVSVNAMILSILYKATPDQVKFIMVDPKMLELSLYDDIPHLLLPVVTDAKKASLALQWAVDEMERRYKLLSEFKVRNLEGFNKKLEILRAQRAKRAPVVEVPADEDGLDAASLLADDASGPRILEAIARSTPPTIDEESGEQIEDPMPDREIPDDLPYIVVLVDEFADLMCVAPRDVEMSIQRLAQKARAAGIHVMLATQRPSTDVVTGVIKNNFPSRIAFKVASRHDSATIINMPGAEQLLGMGDMLALSNTAPEPVRVHGAFVSEEEVQRVVEFWKAQGKPVFDQAILRPREDEGEGDDEDLAAEKDEMYDKAVAIVVESRKASISAVQRRLRVGYNRAARMIELMEKEGIVSAAMGPKGDREVLVQAMNADGPARN